jgi:RNA polymerase sigma factor (sigma-70 family)
MEAQALPRSGRLFLPRSRKALRALGDERLVEQVRRGNDDAFEVIYDRHHRGILAFCRHVLASADEAEDALQQTFISAYHGMAAGGREFRLKPWLYGIARNKCLSMPHARREGPAELDELATAGLSEQVQQRADLRELLHDLHALPVDQRAALVLTEVGGLSHADVGSVVGCEAAKVKSLVFQARSSLIETRNARAIPCQEIREQLATATGGALRRRPLRRHLRACAGCAEFRDEVMRQRKALATILPVVPTVGLKGSLLASIGFGGGGGGAAIGGGAAAAGSGIGTLAASGGATKLATLVALGGLALGGEVIIDGKTPSHTAEARAGQDGSIQASLAPSAVAGRPVATASHLVPLRHLRTRPASGAPGSSPNVTAPGGGHATSRHGTTGRPVRTHAPQSPGSAPGATPPASTPSGSTTTTSPAPASTRTGNGNGNGNGNGSAGNGNAGNANGNGNAGSTGQHRGLTTGRGNPHAQDSTGVRVPPGHQGEPAPAPAGPPTPAPGRSESAPGHTATASNNGNGNGNAGNNGNGNGNAGNAGGNGNAK